MHPHDQSSKIPSEADVSVEELQEGCTQSRVAVQL